jgi:hypothetical protein
MSYFQLSIRLGLCLVVLAAVGACSKSADTDPSSNVLSIGPKSPAPDRIDVPIVAPVSLNGQGTDQIIQARSGVVQQSAKLLNSDYQPTHYLFSKINPKLDWESLRATFFDGPTKMCGSGPSTESTSILNPFLLVSARFFWQPLWAGKHSWLNDKNSASKADSPDFPLYVKAQNLTWFPKESRAEVTYELSDYIKRVGPWIKDGTSLSDAEFSLHAVNARDFQLRYLYISPDKSHNIILSKSRDAAFKLLDFFHARQFKETSVPCNGLSFPSTYISGLRVSDLPASATMLLWRRQPTKLTDTPDLTFTIHIE